MPYADPNIIANPERIEVLKAYCLLDTPEDPAFDRLTSLAARILHVPVALVSLVDVDRQFFKSQIGLPLPWSESRQTPLSHSFCQHAVMLNEPLIIEDARTHPLVHDNLAIVDLNVIAYAGIPLVATSGHVLGSFCVIDHEPRQWMQGEIEILSELAASVMTEVELRSEIQQRQRVEDDLRASEMRYRTLIDTMQEGVIVQQQNGEIYTCNPAAEAMLGLSIDQIRGVQAPDAGWQILCKDGVPLQPDHNPLIAALRKGQPQSNVVIGIQRPDGVLCWLMMNARPMRYQSDAADSAMIITFVDITEHQENERQKLMLELEKGRTKILTKFLEDSSHEFMTPMTIINSSASIIKKSSDESKRLVQADTIQDQISRMTRLIQNLQQIIRMESLPTLNRHRTDTGSLLQGLVSSFMKAGRHLVAITLETAADVPPISVDPSLLHDALWQLLDNALRHTSADGQITIRTAYQAQQVAIIIKDTGTGIPPEAMPHIFERFYRCDESHTTPGFGLGLPIARSIIERHGGSIVVESALGVGTTVTVLLPPQG